MLGSCACRFVQGTIKDKWYSGSLHFEEIHMIAQSVKGACCYATMPTCLG